MKNIFLAAALMVSSSSAFALTFSPTGSLPETLVRCSDDSLSSDEALERSRWFMACHKDTVIVMASHALGRTLGEEAAMKWFNKRWIMDDLEETMVRARPYYPTFSNVDGSKWLPNVVKSADGTYDCGAAGDTTSVSFKGMCESSCYRPDQRVYFEGGYVPMVEAFARQIPKVVSLDSNSTFERLSFGLKKVEHYTVEARDSEHALVSLQTASGGRVVVTTNHPLIDGNGYMREAKTFHVGDSLVRTNGKRDPIVEVKTENYFGKVYNVMPDVVGPLENVVVAEGFLSGSSWYQNEGLRAMNRVILRSQLPEDILE